MQSPGRALHAVASATVRSEVYLAEIDASPRCGAQVTVSKTPPARTRLRLSDVAGQAIEALTPVAAASQRMLIFAQAAGETPIAGDYRRLLSALLGILRHCIEVAAPAAQILINIHPAATELRLEIDVPVETKSRASETEIRSPSEPPLATGSGLTTAVVAQIIALHGGRLDFFSSKSHQRFVISLPISAEAPSSAH